MAEAIDIAQADVSADQIDVPDPLKPATFRDLLVDLFRLYDPDKLSDVDEILATHANTPVTAEDDDGDGVAGEVEHQELAQFLEDKYSVPGFFDLFEYNFCGKYFDPLKCLYDGHVVPPVPTVRPQDNVHKAQVLVPSQLHQAHVRMGILHNTEMHERDMRWRQGAVPPGLFDWLADSHVEGPLKVLRDMYRARDRVQVTVRLDCEPPSAPPETQTSASSSSSGSISSGGGDSVSTGSMTGYLRAFDAQWNMILLDVVWTRRKPSAADGASSAAPAATDAQPLGKRRRDDQNAGGTASITGSHSKAPTKLKEQFLTQRFDTVLVRGDQVINVRKAPGAAARQQPDKYWRTKLQR